jgi:hypothetical protein
MGRDQLLERVAKLEQERETLLTSTQEAAGRALVRIVREYEVMASTLTAAQAAGTEAVVAGQRARALLREIVECELLGFAGERYIELGDKDAANEADALVARIKKELGS